MFVIMIENNEDVLIGCGEHVLETRGHPLGDAPDLLESVIRPFGGSRTIEHWAAWKSALEVCTFIENIGFP